MVGNIHLLQKTIFSECHIYSIFILKSISRRAGASVNDFINGLIILKTLICNPLTSVAKEAVPLFDRWFDETHHPELVEGRANLPAPPRSRPPLGRKISNAMSIQFWDLYMPAALKFDF
jgi:hypothetical protein